MSELNNFHKNCLICQSLEIKLLKGFEEHQLIKCRKCNFVFQKRIPSDEEFRMCYAPHEDYVYGVNYYLSPVTVKRYNELLDYFEKYRKNNRILDVGCGIGYFLDVAKERGWNVYGTEYAKKAIQICTEKGISMKQGKLDSFNYENGFFDVITSFEVIEHINNPQEEIKHIKTLLRPDGIFYCTTPSFNSLSRLILGSKWNVILYPSHLAYYTRKTLSILINNSGLKKIKIITTGFSITRFKTSMPKYKYLIRAADEKYVTPDSDDELLRSRIDKNKYLQFVKNFVNIMLRITGTGDTIKAIYQKR